MKSLIFLLVSLTLVADLSAQQVYTIKADSTILIGCDSNELIIENHTQNVPGFLFNTGHGRTVFKRGAQQLNDSIYLVGSDTIHLPFHPWLQGGNHFGATGVLGTLDSNHLDFYTARRQQARLTASGNFLVGTQTDNGNKFQVTGSSYFNGTQQITGTTTQTASSGYHSIFNPTITAPATNGSYSYGYYFSPILNSMANSQQLGAVAIVPTYNLNGFTQFQDAISAALYVSSNLGGIRIDQASSYPVEGNTGNPLFINQGVGTDKTAIYIDRNGSPTAKPLIFFNDNRAAASKGYIVPIVRNSISTPTAGGGVSFILDRYYSPTEASIDMHYETTPDTSIHVNTSIAFNTTSAGFPATPFYLNGKNVGVGTKTPSAQLHTTGTVRFAGLTADSTQTRILVSDASGNLFYRSASSLAAGDLLRSSLAVNGPIKAKSLTLNQSDWPDYVFDSTYQLPALTDVEKYIRQQHHLPGIPSAAETNEKGIDVGTNQALLLKKIEELSLYIIEQNKKVEALANEVRQLKDQKGKK